MSGDRQFSSSVQNKFWSYYAWGAHLTEKNAEVKMSKNFLTNDSLGVILCGESIARTPEP
jgi:hypothetical protein